MVYEVDVSNKKLRWNLWLRFEFFFVEQRIVFPPFPDKRLKLFTDHFNAHFIENRRMLLDNYLQRILANRYLRHSEIFISFLTPPDNEEMDTKTVAHQQHQQHDDDHKAQAPEEHEEHDDELTHDAE